MDNRITFDVKRSVSAEFDKVIFWSPNQFFDLYRLPNYSSSLVFLSRELEKNRNLLYPSSFDVLYLENKSYMYRKFKELNIRHPYTTIFKSVKDVINNDQIKFPILLKGEHSFGSDSIYKFESKENLIHFLESSNFMELNSEIILQDLLNMRKDLRVTIVNNEVVLALWRINKSEEWRPTATKFGSTVSFEFYPKEWESDFIETMKKLDLAMGAFDVAWEDDDLNKKPLYLEVSPRFSPNPRVDLTSKKYEYGEYKKKFLLKEGFDFKQVDTIFDINKKFVTSCLKNRLTKE
jgi:glutathione synthase/RimK-type ligase-like ATP-grasp enzyme